MICHETIRSQSYLSDSKKKQSHYVKPKRAGKGFLSDHISFSQFVASDTNYMVCAWSQFSLGDAS